MRSIRTMVTLDSIIRSGNMSTKIHVITLRKRKGEDEVIEGHDEIFKDDVSCLYQDRNGVFILKKSGILTKVKHTLEELRPYFDL